MYEDWSGYNYVLQNLPKKYLAAVLPYPLLQHAQTVVELISDSDSCYGEDDDEVDPRESTYIPNTNYEDNLELIHKEEQNIDALQKRVEIDLTLVDDDIDETDNKI